MENIDSHFTFTCEASTILGDLLRFNDPFFDPIELEISGVKYLGKITRMAEQADGGMDVDWDVIDVLEPPEAREQWLALTQTLCSGEGAKSIPE